MTDSTERPAPPPESATPLPADHPGLSLRLSDDGALLQATFQPTARSDTATPPPEAPAAVALTAAAVRAQMVRQGHGNLAVNEQALAQLVQLAATSREAVTLTLAERRDARSVIKISRNRMSALLTLTPPQGGAPMTLDKLKAQLADQGVTAGINEQALALAVASQQVDDLEVASGQLAVNGEHTRFETLVPDTTDRHPRLNAHGLIDYRDLGDLVVVREGTPLMRRIPPTPGVPGFDVTGQALSPKPGTSWPFAPGLKGVELDRGDPNLLVASVVGQPVIVARGVKVDPNVVFPQVDMASGNVKFDGAVNIKGDVKEGMHVYSTGDVFVGGAVEAATIEAGGNVVIKGGVIGRNEYNGRDSGREGWFNAKVTAKGSISARFAENAFLEADVDVMLEDYAMHSEINALNHVVIGKPGTRKGRCMGGHTKATISIRVAESGSSAGLHTVLEAGYNPLVTEEMAALTQAIQKHESEMANLQKIIDFVQQHPERDRDGLLARAAITQELHQGQILELQLELSNLKDALTLAEDAQVSVDVTIHGGTEIHVGGKVWTTAEQRAHAVFRLDDEGNLTVQ
ncbi:MAG: hypothetical protein C0445_08220 [Polaromonas sp.]|nr:hypothetical protein [Polaromonas sp.]